MDVNPYEPSLAPAVLNPSRRLPLALLFSFAIGIPLSADLTALLATGTVSRFMSLTLEAASLLLLAWPISVSTVFWISFAHKSASNAGQLESRQLLWLAPLIVIPITMLVWGAVFEHGRGRGYVRWQLTVVHWAFFASIAIAILGILFNRGRRSFVAASTILLLLFSFSCSFTAGSAVTGDWL